MSPSWVFSGREDSSVDSLPIWCEVDTFSTKVSN